MALLQPDYYKDALKPAAPASTTPAPAPVQAAPQQPAPFSQAPAPVNQAQPFATPGSEIVRRGAAPGVPIADQIASTYRPIHLFGDLSEEEQVKKFGGVVGSAEYYANQAKPQNTYLKELPLQLMSSIGVMLPDDETWDRMSTADKAINIAQGQAYGLARIVTSLPREIAKIPVRFGVSLAKPFQQDPDKVTELPWLGSVPTYYQTYQEAKSAGMGPLAASLYTGGLGLGDATLVGSVMEAPLRAAFQPRAAIRTPIGEATVQNVAPIKQALVRDNGGRVTGVAKAESSSEYYTLPDSVAEQFKGTKNNTYFKVTPASPDSVEISVVQTRGGAMQRAADWMKGTKTYSGDFGPEVKVQSQIVKVGEGSPMLSEALSTMDKSKIGATPPAPLRGMENKPVTAGDLANLAEISKVNGIQPGIRDAVIRSVTGKSVMGEMTQAEYVKAAQTLLRFSESGKLVQEMPWLNPMSRYVSPQRHWMRNYEEKSGIPLYSEVYYPLEEGFRVRNVFEAQWKNKAREIFGKYTGNGFAEERRLITAYMQGDKNAIAANTTIDDAVKADLTRIADDMSKTYDEIGPLLDVPKEIFLKDYAPHVQDIGGIFQLYKKGAEMPSNMDFFAKFKRIGNFTAPLIDDSLALFDIYVRSGANRMFIGPNLDRIAPFTKNLPSTLQDSVKSYVLEKLGYAGGIEEALDKAVPRINQRLGLNLPPDTARQMTQLTMSTQYSGLLSSPATWFRQNFQYPLFGYARLGPRYAGEAYKKALTPSGLDEVRKAGFFVDLGVPYGEELTKDITLGGRAGNIYKSVTQVPIAPNSIADNVNRAVVYHQLKMQFEDALAKYNTGKIQWSQLESELDFPAFSPVDRNMIRQKLVSGDVEGAFNQMARDVIDETNFPYRKAAGNRIGYGLGGKVGTSLLQWPVEAVHTLTRWAKTGQRDKLIRWAAANIAIQRTFQDTFGVDFSRSLLLGPFNNVYSPAVQVAQNMINTFTAAAQNNREEMNANADKVVRTLRAAGTPAGVLTKQMGKFWDSYNRGNQMIEEGSVLDPSKPFPVLDEKGRVRSYTDFAGLFWGELMGFPMNQKESDRRLLQDMRNAETDRSGEKEKVMQLLQQGRNEEAGELIEQTGVSVTAEDFKAYYIPLTERTFQTLPKILKAQFVDRVYPPQEEVVQ